MEDFEETEGSDFSEMSREHLIAEVNRATYQANFWFVALTMAAQRNSLLDLEPGSPREVLDAMVRYAVAEGLKEKMFSPDVMPSVLPGLDEEETDGIRQNWQENGIPWDVAEELCATLNIDITDLLDSSITHGQEAVLRAAAIRGDFIPMPGKGDIDLDISGMTAVNMADLPPDVINGLLDKLHEKSEGYVLHVFHDGHPCRHVYKSLDMAIEAAARDEAIGQIERAMQISHLGEVVVSEGTLRERINDINAAPNN